MSRGRKPIEEITDKQKEVLQMIVEFIQEKGYQPSRQDLADRMGITRHAATQRVWQLSRKGFVRLQPGGGERCLILPGLRFEARIETPGLDAEHRQVLVEVIDDAKTRLPTP